MAETLTKTIVNCETGETTIEPLTAEEAADLEAMRAKAAEEEEAAKAEAEAKAAARASALAKLATLGLTEEEAAAIVGA